MSNEQQPEPNEEQCSDSQPLPTSLPLHSRLMHTAHLPQPRLALRVRRIHVAASASPLHHAWAARSSAQHVILRPAVLLADGRLQPSTTWMRLHSMICWAATRRTSTPACPEAELEPGSRRRPPAASSGSDEEAASGRGGEDSERRVGQRRRVTTARPVRAAASFALRPAVSVLPCPAKSAAASSSSSSSLSLCAPARTTWTRSCSACSPSSSSSAGSQLSRTQPASEGSLLHLRQRSRSLMDSRDEQQADGRGGDRRRAAIRRAHRAAHTS